MEVLREGRRVSFRVKRVPPPKDIVGETATFRGRSLLAGLKVRDLTPYLARKLGLRLKGGVLVTSVAPGSNAYRTGFERGDIILGINRRTVRSVRELRAVLRESRRVRDIVIWRRGGILRMHLG